MKYIYNLIFLAIAIQCRAQTAQDVLDYAIPDSAIRGPLGNDLQQGYRYQDIFPPNTDLTTRRTEEKYSKPVQSDRIGFEEFFEGHLVGRVLIRKQLRFGVTRKWHENGQLASEEPYRDDVMDGLFRQWDDQGRLVAQYIIRNGDGTKRIYNSLGEMIREEHLVKGKLDGWCTAYSEIHGARWVAFFVNGKASGITLDFDRDWHTLKISWHPNNIPETNLHGPQISFLPDGTVANAKWYLNGKKVSEVEYASAAAKDTSLPPYYIDKTKYREINDSEARTVVQHYKNLPRVKIPLEFDAQGNPVPAEPVSKG